jgi:hypothetical protein
MIFTASRGQAFKEEFNFKNPQGRPIAVPKGDFRLTLERGSVAREVPIKVVSGAIIWTMTADEVSNLEYTTMYFHLTFNGQEISRGVLRVN